MKIPCYLTIFEQVTWPRRMAQECERLGLEVILLDNGSTYPPCVDWLNNCPYKVIRMEYNAGCYGFFNSGMHKDQTGPYVLSDSDLDLSGVPNDAVARMAIAQALNPKVDKVGLSLEIDDVPESYPFYETVLKYEQPYWQSPLPGGCWYAGVGATFALYLPQRSDYGQKDVFYNAARLDRPYTAKHLPWYLDLDNLDEENLYYYSRCDNVAHYSSKVRQRLQDKTKHEDA